MPRKGGDSLNIKVRVITTRKMKKQEAVKKVRQAVKRRVVPEGIEILWLDWSRPEEEGRASEGTLLDDAAYDALVDFYFAMTDPHARMRIAVVDEEGEEREVLEG